MPKAAATTAERSLRSRLPKRVAQAQECLLKELKLFRDATRVMSEEERRHALRGLNSLVRPRSAPLHALPRISSSPLMAGSPVRLAGLRSRAEFNGTRLDAAVVSAGPTMGEVLDRDPDSHGQLLVRLFPEGASQKLVWVDPGKLQLEASPMHTRAGKQWLTKPLKHLAHHSFKRGPNGGFFSCLDEHGSTMVADGRAEAVDVYMYYWDSRDGPSFEGWWFGNKLGGTQVWSHNASASLTPPPSGWKIPWDGSVRNTLSVANKADQQKNEAQMKLKNMTTEVNSVSTAAKGALDQAKAAAADYTSSEGLKEAETLLQPQLSALAEAMKQLTDAQRAGSNQETLRQVQQMRSGLQALMSAINVELGKVRSSKQKAEQSEKQKALEERDMTVFQEILPEAVSKANAAEDAVEKAVITSEMIAAGGDDLDEVRQAVGATEQAVQEAQKAMGEARIFLNAKQAAARFFGSLVATIFFDMTCSAHPETSRAMKSCADISAWCLPCHLFWSSKGKFHEPSVAKTDVETAATSNVIPFGITQAQALKMDASLTATSFGYVTAKYTLSAETELLPGLTYLKDFLTVDEEQALLAEVDGKLWDGDNKSRRTQQFGYGFHWRNRHSKALLRLPAPRDRMPQAALKPLVRLERQGHIPAVEFQQCIVNDYVGGQGIKPHRDREFFGELVLGISLLEPVVMDFKCIRTHQVRALLLEPRRYESEKVKAKAIQELGQLQQQLQEAQGKLSPLKNVRQEFVQRTAAQKMMQEVLEKLSPAEVDVDRAEEATQMLTSEEGASKELMVQAQQAVAKAGEHVHSVVRFIEAKKKSAVGLAKEELAKMEERARQSVQRLANLKSSQKEATEKVGLEVLVKEAAEKLQTVQDTVAKAADAEGPFLMGVEELPLDETLAAVKAVETASTAANTAASIARMFIATKLVEAKRFTPELSKEAQTKLKAFQSDLETHTKRLNELKKATAERKKAVTVREAEHEVKKAEELGKAVAEAAKALMDDEKLTQLSSEEIRAASEATIKAEQAASNHLTETRKYITARQIEAKGREASSELSSELIKYEARLRVVSTEIGKYKKVSASVDSRLKAKKSLEDCNSKVKAVEQKFEKLTELADAIDHPKEDPEAKDEAKDGEAKDGEAKDGEAKDGEGDENASNNRKLTSKEKVQKALKEAEAAAAEVQAAIKSAARFIDMQIKVTPAAAKDVEKLKPRLDELQETLDKTVSGMRERSEKVMVDSIDSASRVNDVDEAIKKMQKAEEPFNGDIEPEKVSESLSNLELATQAATQALSGAKTFVGVKKLACKRLAEGSKKSAEDQLSGIVAKLDELAKTLAASKTLGQRHMMTCRWNVCNPREFKEKLDDFTSKKAMQERKQDLVKKEVEGKVLEAEKKLQASEEAMKALAEFDTPAEAAEGEDSKAEEGAGWSKEPWDWDCWAEVSLKSIGTKAPAPAVLRPDEMKSACEKAGSAQTEARQVVVAAQKLLLSRQKDAKNGSGSPSEINRQLEQLSKFLASLDKHRAAVKEQEHKFVAQRLLKDGIAKLEKMFEATTERAALLTEDGGMSGVVFLSHAVDCLKGLMKKSSKTPKDRPLKEHEGTDFTTWNPSLDP
eukprot:s332_g63.t4